MLEVTEAEPPGGAAGSAGESQAASSGRPVGLRRARRDDRPPGILGVVTSSAPVSLLLAEIARLRPRGLFLFTGGHPGIRLVVLAVVVVVAIVAARRGR